MAAEQAAGVTHHVGVLIVGCELVPMRYFRAKAAQEQVLEHGPMRHQHFHRHHRFGGCDSGAAQDAGRRGRGERIRTVHELHRALASVTRTGHGQLRGEAAQIVAEATSRLNGLLAGDARR